MATTNLPAVISDFKDGNLTVTTPAKGGESVLLIGTADDGPLYEPVNIDVIEDAKTVFGSPTAGTLIRGIYEAYNGSLGRKDIRGVRIGNAKTAVAYVMPSGVEDPSGSFPPASGWAMKLEGRYPGDKYNTIQFSRSLDTITIAGLPDDTGEGITSVTFRYHPDLSKTTDYDVHDNAEIVDAINANVYTSKYVVATNNTPRADWSYTIGSEDNPEVASSLAKDIHYTTVDGTDSTPVTAINLLNIHQDVADGSEPDASVSNHDDAAGFMLLYELDAITATVSKTENIPAGTKTFKLSFVPANPSTAVFKDANGDTISMTWVSTLSELSQPEHAYDTHYFISGQTLTFGATTTENRTITYTYEYTFVEGSDVEINETSTVTAIKDVNKAYEGNNDLTLGDLRCVINFINPDTRPSVGDTLSLSYTYQEWTAGNGTTDTLSGGTDGTNMSTYQLYNELDTLYERLENYIVDCVVPLGVYLDDTKTEYDPNDGTTSTVNAGFHGQLDAFLKNVSVANNETYGIIAVRPPENRDAVSVNQWVNDLTVTTGSSTDLRAANIMNAFDSFYVSVVAMNPWVSNSEFPIYSSDGAALYAGRICTLQPHSSPTNKVVGGVVDLRFDLSNAQLEALTEARYVTLRRRAGRGIVVTDAMTAANSSSDFTRLSTVRIAFAAMDVVRFVAEPFIGEPNTPQQRNALDTAVSEGLAAMVEKGALQDYDFVVTATDADLINGDMVVEMILVPAFETRRIRVTTKLAFAI